MTVTLFVTACCFLLLAWHERDQLRGDQLKPNVFRTTLPKWLFDSDYRIDFDAHESLVVSNWITTHQTGWKFGSEDDFDPHKTQFLCDNYVIQIDTNVIVFQYYKREADYAHDPSDSFIIIKRLLSPEEQSFWREQVSQIKTSNPLWVKLPTIRQTSN
jgi:hypothetical protein